LGFWPVCRRGAGGGGGGGGAARPRAEGLEARRVQVHAGAVIGSRPDHYAPLTAVSRLRHVLAAGRPIAKAEAKKHHMNVAAFAALRRGDLSARARLCRPRHRRRARSHNSIQIPRGEREPFLAGLRGRECRRDVEFLAGKVADTPRIRAVTTPERWMRQHFVNFVNFVGKHPRGSLQDESPGRG
jgi:hypothetical protein